MCIIPLLLFCQNMGQMGPVVQKKTPKNQNFSLRYWRYRDQKNLLSRVVKVKVFLKVKSYNIFTTKPHFNILYVLYVHR